MVCSPTASHSEKLCVILNHWIAFAYESTSLAGSCSGNSCFQLIDDRGGAVANAKSALQIARDFGLSAHARRFHAVMITGADQYRTSQLKPECCAEHHPAWKWVKAAGAAWQGKDRVATLTGIPCGGCRPTHGRLLHLVVQLQMGLFV